MIITLIVGLVVLAGLAQWYRFQRDILGEALSDAHRWVDEIIEALQSEDKVEGERSAHRLAAQFKSDECDCGD